jgi:hypothetical protein
MKNHTPISTITISEMQECDVISVSKSDYIYEYEVKISRADYKKDFIKETYSYNKIIHQNKKKELKNFTTTHYFNFVSRDLITIDEVPDYAGLIYIDEDGSFEIIKKQNYYKNKSQSPFIRKLAHNLTCKLVF